MKFRLIIILEILNALFIVVIVSCARLDKHDTNRNSINSPDSTNKVLTKDSLNEFTLEVAFLSMPPEFTSGLSQNDKKVLISNYKTNNNNLKNGVSVNHYYLSAFDSTSNYLSYSGFYEGSSEIRFWNLPDGKKLIVVGEISCGPICDYQVRFLNFDGKEFHKVSRADILPEIGFSDFFKVEDMQTDEIVLETWQDEFEKLDIVLKLPRTGENIIAESQFNEFSDMSETEMEIYSKGNKLELVWSGGRFIKGKVY